MRVCGCAQCFYRWGEVRDQKSWETPCLSLAPITKSHRLGGLSNRHLFLTGLEAKKFKTKVLAIWFLASALVLPCRQAPSPRILTWLMCPWMELVLSFSSYKATCLLDWYPILTTSLNLNYLLKALSSKTITLGVNASTYEFEGTHPCSKG